MSPRACWALVGLALAILGASGVWWSYNGLQSRDMEAPFVVSAFNICCFGPLALICFLMALLVRKQDRD